MEITALQKLGLTHSEIEVYLELLKSGTNTASKIAEKTKLNRTHIYDTLKKLIQKGFISFYEKNKIKYFNASSPEQISNYIKEIEKEVAEIIPDLNELKETPKEETKVQLFEGKQGIKNIFKDILKERKDYVVFGEETQFQKIFPIFIEQFLRDVRNYNIKERLLTKKEFKKTIMTTKNSQVRYLKGKYFSPTSTVVYGNKVATFIWSEPYHVTLIDDKEVADSFRVYFEYLWKQAKP